MSTPSTETKLRLLASANVTLQGYLGTPPAVFRWFHIQMPQRYIAEGPCVRVRRISTRPLYVMTGLNPITCPMFQIDVLSVNDVLAGQVADAVISFLGTVDLASNAQFGSPATTPTQYPSFLANRRSAVLPQPEPIVFVESIDAKLYALEA